MKIRNVWYLFLIMLLISFGCTTKLIQKSIPAEQAVQKTPAKVEPPPPSRTEEAKERVTGYEDLRSPEFKRPFPEKNLPPREPFDPKRFTLIKDPVMINVEKMPLSDFIIYALGETLKVPFVTDQKVMENKEPITFSMPQAMPPDRALEIILGLFERYSLYLEERAGALYILQKSPEPKQPFDIRIGREISESPAQILQVVPLKHIRPMEIAPLIGDLYKGMAVQVRGHPRGENVILLYGQASQVKQIMEFIEIFDVPYIQGKKKVMFRLTYWQIDDFIKQISQILEGMGLSITKSPKEPGILFIPIKALGSLLVIAADDKSLNYVLEWKERLDTPEAAGSQERPFTYVPRYSAASDLVKSIRALYGIMPAQQPIPARPPDQPLTPEGRPPIQPAPTTTTGQPAAVPITGLKISADDSRNIIMVVSTPEVYKNILSLLKELDVPPRQVLIEATVVELTLTDELQYGLQWYINNRMFKGRYTLESLLGAGSSSGLVYNFVSNTQKFNALLNLFASLNKVNILSTPRLMVLDNQEATIQVGTDVPILTGAATVPAGSTILSSYTYRHTGTMLRVKPTINSEGLLTLSISQEVSEMGANPPGISSPTILTRTINTTVVSAQGESIALGGLISESKGLAITKIPFLGDIPVIGALFRSSSISHKRTELLVLLTPTILTSVDEAARITRDLKRELQWLK
jgi:general secretion pathway protein D